MLLCVTYFYLVKGKEKAMKLFNNDNCPEAFPGCTEVMLIGLFIVVTLTSLFVIEQF